MVLEPGVTGLSEVPACPEMLIFEDIGNAIPFSHGNLFVKATP
jgi:hypothetical protein